MALASAKRTYESMSSDITMGVSSPGGAGGMGTVAVGIQSHPVSPSQCAPRTISFLESPRKRPRQPLSHHTPSLTTSARVSPFHIRPSAIDDTAVNAAVDKKTSRVTVSATAADDDDQGEDDERLYSSKDVKIIVRRALQEMEAKLRDEYGRILQEQLAEQYQNFARFTDDYIMRKIKASTHDYMS